VSSVSAVRDDGGKAGFPKQDGGRGEEESLGCPSLDPMPKAVHASKGVGAGSQMVCPIVEYREQEALDDTVEEERPDTGAGGG